MSKQATPISDSDQAGGLGAVHFLTIRTAGSLAAERLGELRIWRDEQLELVPTEPRLARRYHVRIQQRYFTEYDRLLDRNRDNQMLQNPRMAACIRQQLYRQQAAYQLLAYVIMPNHVHMVVRAHEQPGEAAGEFRSTCIPDCMDEKDDACSPLVDYLREFKTATACEGKKLRDRGAELIWHPESFDYWVRSLAELEAIVEYLAENPVAAELVRSRELWFFSSAHDRFLHDGHNSGWLPETIDTSCNQRGD